MAVSLKMDPDGTTQDTAPVVMTVLEMRAIQAIAAALGCVLLILALLPWLSADPGTIRTTQTRVVTSGGVTAKTGAPRRARVVTTSSTVAQGPAGARPRSGHPPTTHWPRSETLSTALVGAGLLLLLVGILFPRLRGAGGAGASVALDPIALARSVAQQRRVADSRLPDDVADRASAVVATTLGIPDERGSAAARKTSKKQLSAIIDDTVTAFVRRPEVRNGAERYAGDFVARPGTGAAPVLIGRILFYNSREAFDILQAGSGVTWGSDEARHRTVRTVLAHASGDRPVSTESIDAFLEDHAELLSSGKPWSISLTEILSWIDNHAA